MLNALSKKAVKLTTALALTFQSLLLTGATTAQAHPHIWIDAFVTLHFDEGAINRISVHWAFDELYSGVVIQDYDENGNGKLDPNELAQITAESREALRDYNYFTYLTLGQDVLGLTDVEDLQVTVDKDILVYDFSTPLPRPVDPHETDFSFSLYDETYYVELLLDEEVPVRVEGKLPGNCYASVNENNAFQAVEPADGIINYSFGFPRVVNIACDKT